MPRSPALAATDVGFSRAFTGASYGTGTIRLHDGVFVRSIRAPFSESRPRAGFSLITELDWLVPDYAAEAAGKRQHVRDLLTDIDAEVVVIRDTPTVRWLLCGRGGSFAHGDAAVVIDGEAAIVLVPELAVQRITQEEHLDELGYRLACIPRTHGLQPIVDRMTEARRVADPSVEQRLLELRSELQPAESVRLRAAGRASAEAMTATFAQLHPDMSERDAAAQLAFEMTVRGVCPRRISVAGETRHLAYTLAPPGCARLGRNALFAVDGERAGLSVAMTRIVSFVEPTTVLASRVAIAAEIEARLVAASVPGAFTGDIRALAVDAFAEFGFSDDQAFQCDGGLGGYDDPPFDDAPAADAYLNSSCVVSWRPILPGGGASQDTVLVSAAGPEVVTWMPELEELFTSGLPRPAIVRL